MPSQSKRSSRAPSKSNADKTPATDPSKFIDDYAIERVDYHVGRITRSYRINLQDAEDLRQNLFVALCKAARRFDPRKACRRTFVSGVLALAAAHESRCIRNERRHSARSPMRLSELQRNGDTFAPAAPRSYEPSAVDLALDLRQGLAATSRRQQLLAESLKSQSASEIAADEGVHRSTIYRRIAPLRAALSEFGLDPST